MRLGSPKCSFALTLLCLTSLTPTVFPQIAGDNVNMVSGTKWPGGDPFLQRQNEPSLAVSTRNPLHLLAGANDYRTVDLNLADALPTGQIGAGDAWLGVFKSFDGGRTWQSTLLPGYPQDKTAEGILTPLHLFKTASDPTVRAGTNGMFYYGGIAFNRDTQKGEVFVARYIDLDNKENGDATQAQDSIRYLGATPVELNIGPDRGEGEHEGGFLDKPALVTDVPRPGAGSCRILARQSDGSLVTQNFLAGNVYIAYSVFGNTKQGPDTESQIVFRRSTDCGVTWDPDRVLTLGSSSGSLNQGASIAVDPQTGAIYVVWRQFRYLTEPDAIVVAKSVDGGTHFSKPSRVITLPAFDPKNPSAASFFDQNTSSTEFRSNAFPTIAVDDSGTPGVAGRAYVAWSQRGLGPEGDARIVLSSSSDGSSWSTPAPIDNRTLTDDVGGSFSRGHQLMPQITFNAGKLLVTYYDFRYDHTIGMFNPYSPFVADAKGNFYQQTRDVISEPGSAPPVFGPFVDDAQLSQRRHTIDVMVAQSDGGAAPSFSYAKVSQYKIGLRGDQYETEPQELQSNPPNLPLFAQGTAPFLGDYIDVAGQTFIRDANGAWHYNNPVSGGAPSNSAVFYTVWTSDQDVRAPQDGNWKNYTPVGTDAGRTSTYDPTQTVPNCIPGQEGMRNQNIYSSRITQGLMLSSPQNSKPLSASLQRGFVVLVQNFTNFDKSFRLSISAPAGVFASFQQILPNPTAPPASFPAPVATLDVTVAAHSGASRTLFAMLKNSSASSASTITVNASEIDAPGPAANQVAGGLSSFTLLNPDSGIPALVGPDGVSGNVGTSEIYDAAISAPNVTNPNVTNPNVTNPNVTNPNVTNPNVTNPNVTNPDLANPNVTNPNVTNSDVLNPNVTNPNVTNGNIGDTPVADATYVVRNNGNTTASYRLRLAGQPSVPLQLLLNKTYLTPVGVNCQLMEESQQTLQANITNPNFESPSSFSDPNVTNPNVTNATLALAPGETALVTLRGNVCTAADASCMSKHPDLPTMDQVVTQQVAPVAQPQAVNTTNTTATTPPVTAPPIPVILTASFPDAIAGASGYSVQLQAVGGTAPYSWSAANLPPGFSVNPATGLLSNSNPAANTPGTFNLTAQLTDAAGKTANHPFTLRVVAPLIVSSFGNASGLANSPFSFSNTAQGGVPPYAWHVAPGSSLPAGISLASTGVISGTVATAGSYTAILQVTDSGTPQQTTTQQLAINIITSYDPAQTFSASANPNGPWSYGYTSSFGAAFTLLPAIDTTSAAGIQYWGMCLPFANCQPLVGVITQSGPYDQPDTIAMHPGPQSQYAVLRFTAPTAGTYHLSGFFEGDDPHPTTTDVHVAVNGSVTFNANVNSYATPIGFDQTVYLDPGANGGTLDFLVGNGGNGMGYDTTALHLVIAPATPAPLAITSPASTSGYLGVPFSFSNAAQGGVPPYAWAVSPGSALPPGLSLGANGAISGTPTTSGTFNIGFQVTDSESPKQTQVQQLTLTIQPNFDAFRDFSGSTNPNGAWSYGSENSLGAAFTLDQRDTTTPPGAQLWSPCGAYLSCKTFIGVQGSPLGTILALGPSPNGLYEVLRFTAPITGNFHVQGNFVGADPYPTTTDDHIVGPGGIHYFDVNINAYNQPAPFDVTVALHTGETLDFAVGNGGNGSDGDTTGLSVTITPPALNAFSQTGSMMTARNGHTSTLLNDGRVLLTGGNSSGPYLDSAEIYDPQTQIFTGAGKMSVARLGHTATLLSDGRVLITGGLSGNGILNSAEIYDPVMGTFTVTGNMKDARQYHAATLLNDGRVLITGGVSNNGVILGSAEIFDPGTATFTPVAGMNVARKGHAATRLNDGRVLVTGGYGTGGELSAAEIYDPGTSTFLNTGSMNSAREYHTATLLNEGRVLVTGGDSNTGDLSSAEIYDSAAGTFLAVGSMNAPRQLHTATLLNNGSVLIAGGINSTGALNTVEIYVPVTAAFTAAGSMTSARIQHAATLLNNGQVLVTAGSNNGFLSSAELYNPATLIPPGLVSIQITPGSSSLVAGSAARMLATGTYADGHVETLQSVTWSSSDTSIVQVTNDATDHGRAYALAAGNAVISACAGTLCGSMNLTISSPIM